MFPPWRRPDLPQGIKLFLALLAFSFLLVQTVFGALFAGVPLFLFAKYWWPAFRRYLVGDFSPNESAFVLFLFGGIGLLFFAIGTMTFLSGARSLVRFFGSGIDGLADRQRADRLGAIARMRARPTTNTRGGTSPTSLLVSRSPDGVFRLSTRPTYRLLTGIAFGFAAFWNLVVGLALADLARGGSISILFGIFLVPFVLVGIGLLALTVYLFLASLLPPIQFRLEKEEFRRGDTVAVHWNVERRPTRLKHFDALLQVVETLIEGSGEDETRHSDSLLETPVAEAVSLQLQTEGTIRVTLPEQAPPSSADAQREVNWFLYFHGQTDAMLPDFRFWLPLAVR